MKTVKIGPLNKFHLYSRPILIPTDIYRITPLEAGSMQLFHGWFWYTVFAQTEAAPSDMLKEIVATLE